MGLRQYQQDAVVQLRAAVRRSRTAVYVLPTGGGKTVVAADMARRAARNGKRTMLLVHRRELVRQAVDTLAEAMPDLSVGVEASGWPAMPWAYLQVGMVQSIVRRETTARPDLVIVDEAHHVRTATWDAVLARWPNAATVGLTATPQRLDGKGLGAHFAEMVLGPTIPELVDLQNLAPTRTLSIPSHLNTAGLKTDRHGEYRVADLTDRITDDVIGDAVHAYQNHTPGKRAIFFGITVEHSKRVCEALRALGYRAEHVDGTDSDSRRDRVMQSFKTGGLECVGNCNLISEGFDAPACDVAILGFKTASVTRYLQANRASRYRPGKTAVFMDLGGTAYELGNPDEIRTWTLEDGELKDPIGKSTPRPRTCGSCSTSFYGPNCSHCGEPYRGPGPNRTEVETELVDLTGRRRPKKPARPKSKMTRRELNGAIYAARKSANPYAALCKVAEANGYRRNWVTVVLNLWKKTEQTADAIKEVTR